MENKTVLDRIIEDSIPIWDECINTPFVQEITDGTIADEKVLKYIVEDSLYLLEYAKCFAYEIAKCKTLEDIRYFYGILGFVNEDETSIRREFIKNHNLTDFQVETKTPDAVCKEYTDFMLSQCKNEDIKEGLCSILPCMLSYQYIFKNVYNKKPQLLGTKYARIIAFYCSNEYKDLVKEWKNKANTICGKLSVEEEKHLTDIFRTASEFELKFWKMSYDNALEW